jgi:Ca2+-binding EF-hand superfamily protein
MKTQLRFASSLTKEREKEKLKSKSKSKGKRVSTARERVSETVSAAGSANYSLADEIIIPDEMNSWLANTLTEEDDQGYLPEAVGSALTQPLDSFAAFCPTGNLLTSKFSALRIPEKPHYDPSMTMAKTDFTTQSHMSFSQSMELERASEPKKVNFDSAVNRLNVMWLQRKSQLEKEDGDLDASYKTMGEALNLHFGGESEYEKADPSGEAGITDPNELMLELGEAYFPYDSTAHNRADYIQRWYHKRYLRKLKAVGIINRVYLGYLVRRGVWRLMAKRNQCARIVQRRFLHHLSRMKYLATKLKYWYRLRVSMRDYQARIHIYRMARRIQRLFRGNQGRKIGNYRRLRRNSAMVIQRNVHGFVLRRRRALGITQFHKIFFNAAVKIQCLCRSYISVCRAKARILEELMREERRMERENAVVEETISNEIARTQLYLKTGAGKLHYESCKHKIIAMDKEFERIKHTLTPEEILVHEAQVIFEVYDSDGSGTIDLDELRLMLVDLCVPVNAKELKALAEQLDGDGSGDIDFAEFSEWFSEGGSSSTSGMGAAMFKQILKARRLVLELSGQLIAKRSERAVLRQCCSWLTNETKALFRLTDAPKFNCCKCLQTFVLFQDYIQHFTRSEKLCIVTGERGMFHPKWWIHSEWINERQCEVETMRVAFEYPTLSYRAMLANYAELALQNDSGVSLMLKGQVEAASSMYITLLEESHADENKTGFYGKQLSSFIYDISAICDDGFLSPNVAKQIAYLLKVELPTEWIVKSVWSFAAFKDWLDVIPCLQRPAKDLSQNAEEKMIKRDALLLADIYIKCIRLIRVGAETSIVALAEYRIKRPRQIKISDNDLKRNNLQVLTRDYYDEVRQKLIKRLRIIRKAMRHMQVLAINEAKVKARQTKFEKFKIGLKKVFGLSYKPIILDEEPTDEEIELFEYTDTHVRSTAYFKSRLTTRVGKTHVRRLDKELWAHRKHIVDRRDLQKGSNNSNANTRKQLCRLEYIFSLFSSDSYGKGINARDLEMFLTECLNLRYTKEQYESILKALDPLDTGMVAYEQLCIWVLANKHKPFHSRKQFIKNGFNLNRKMEDAKLSILIDIRRITRLELETQKLEIQAIERLLSSTADANPEEDGEKKPDTEVAADESTVKKKKKKKKKKSNKRVLRELRIEQEKRQVEAEKVLELSATLKGLRDNFEAKEQSVLTRMAEDDAEDRAKKLIMFSRKGRYFMSTEIKLLSIAQEMMGVYSESIPAESPYPVKNKNNLSAVDLGWELTLKVLVHCFDTDCSGTFDESEIDLLLKCVKKPISERVLLYFFPDVILDSASLKQVTSYLLPRINWVKSVSAGSLLMKRDVSISTKSFRYASKLLLISLSRQSAREKSIQAYKLAKTGILEDLNEAKYAREVSQGLIMRTQMLAMRQVHKFLTTIYGEIRLRTAKKRLQIYWKEVVAADYSRSSLIKYSFLVHAVTDANSPLLPSKMLNSEFPHLIRYFVTVLKWTVNEDYRPKIAAFSKCYSDAEARWIEIDEATEFLEAAFKIKKKSFFTLTFQDDDARRRMLSIARQQALLIAIDYPDKQVHDTNFRCFILGLDMLMRLKKFDRKAKYSNAHIDWTKVPNDAMLIYLLSQGFTYEDLIDSCPNLFNLKSNFYQATDTIRDDELVNPNELLKIATEDVFSQLSFLSSLHRMARFVGGRVKFMFYKKIVRILLLHREEVNYLGRMFLDEIIIGVSHCSLE